MVQISFWGPFQTIAGQSDLTLPLNSSQSLRSVLNSLCSHFPLLSSTLFVPLSKQIRSEIVISINDCVVRDAPETVTVNRGDHIVIMYAISGG